jgi:phenylalanyl-tRNA synthetase beta chain
VKFSLSWLQDHLKTEHSLPQIVDAMTMAGLEVEEVIDPAQAFAPFSVARIVEAKQHPNADKLQVCQVETRDGLKEIVCGALNARAGLKTVYAPLGTYIPGSGITLESRPVRGVVSHGMLCSETELMIEDDVFGLRGKRIADWLPRAKALGKDEAAARADGGIAELPDDAEVGEGLAALLGLADPVIDFEATPNRPDWLGVAGIARDLAAAGVGKLITKAAKPVKGKFACPIRIETSADAGCPIFAGRVVRGLRNGPSPRWLQERLKAVGLKPRNILVDVTNFLSLDRARPLHVYDASRITGVIGARLGREGERLEALDGKTYEIGPQMCVIADEARVLGLGGVMGGAYSGSQLETTDVFIESAWFDPRRTFLTGRATGIASDAQYRFARGVDPGSVIDGLELATALILELCGGEASDVFIAGAAPAPPAPVAFDPARVKGLAGLDVKPARIAAILKALGFDPQTEQAPWRVGVPSWRRDVEGEADLVEEIARIEGFDKLPTVPPPRAEGMRAPPASVGESRARIARRALAAAGYLEAVTWSFCERRHAALFGGGANKARLLIANPIAADLDCMRPTPLPNLLRAAQRNLDRGFGDSRLFEVGPAYAGDGETDQRRVASAIRQPRPRRHWRNAPSSDVIDIKADCLAVLEAVGAPVAALLHGAASESHWHPGRSGVLKIGPKPIATFGEIHPRTLAALGVEGSALAFEIDLSALPTAKAKASRARPPLALSDLMPLSRDFAFVVDEKVAAADLVRAAYGAEKGLIADVALFDVYRGQGIAEGKKSLAIEVTLQPREKTLTEPEIETVSARIIAAIAKATGGVLRSGG